MRGTVVFVEYAIVSGNFLRGVGENRVGDIGEISFKPGFVAPLRISRRGEYFGIHVGEFLFMFGEAFQFGRANKSEVSWVKEENQPRSFVIR